MKIELELPKWADERNIYILAGIELAAYKVRGKKWLVKTERCNMCGKCCFNVKGRYPLPAIRGQCPHLVKEVGDNDRWLCGLGANRPFGCCIGVTNEEYCSERFEEV